MSTTSNSRGILGGAVHQLRLLLVAVQFFTRVPIPRWVGFDPDWLHHASRYFPAVGWLVGGITAGSYVLAAWLWSPMVAVLLSTIIGIYLTGAFHEDGFADFCDGFGGGMTMARVLEIMKDSRIGAYGAIGIGLMLALKCVVLAAMPAPVAAAALLMAHPLSRLASVSLIWRLAYVKAEGKAKPLAQSMSGAELLIAVMTVSAPVVVLMLAGWLSWSALAAGVVLGALVTVWFARLLVRRIGGYTGDCLGAVQQGAEVGFYLAVLAVVTHGG